MLAEKGFFYSMNFFIWNYDKLNFKISFHQYLIIKHILRPVKGSAQEMIWNLAENTSTY